MSEAIPDTDQRHWSFTIGRISPRKQCPTCFRAMEDGIAGNWFCRPCNALRAASASQVPAASDPMIVTVKLRWDEDTLMLGIAPAGYVCEFDRPANLFCAYIYQGGPAGQEERSLGHEFCSIGHARSALLDAVKSALQEGLS